LKKLHCVFWELRKKGKKSLRQAFLTSEQDDSDEDEKPKAKAKPKPRVQKVTFLLQASWKTNASAPYLTKLLWWQAEKTDKDPASASKPKAKSKPKADSVPKPIMTKTPEDLANEEEAKCVSPSWFSFLPSPYIQSSVFTQYLICMKTLQANQTASPTSRCHLIGKNGNSVFSFLCKNVFLMHHLHSDFWSF
jgi:hypothetical protein